MHFRAKIKSNLQKQEFIVHCLMWALNFFASFSFSHLPYQRFKGSFWTWRRLNANRFTACSLIGRKKMLLWVRYVKMHKVRWRREKTHDRTKNKSTWGIVCDFENKLIHIVGEKQKKINPNDYIYCWSCMTIKSPEGMNTKKIQRIWFYLFFIPCCISKGYLLKCHRILSCHQIY